MGQEYLAFLHRAPFYGKKVRRDLESGQAEMLQNSGNISK
jgi:hypothetical protein